MSALRDYFLLINMKYSLNKPIVFSFFSALLYNLWCLERLLKLQIHSKESSVHFVIFLNETEVVCFHLHSYFSPPLSDVIMQQVLLVVSTHPNHSPFLCMANLLLLQAPVSLYLKAFSGHVSMLCLLQTNSGYCRTGSLAALNQGEQRLMDKETASLPYR